MVAVKPIVDSIAISWHRQFERLKRDPILSKGIRIMRMPFGPGGAQDVTCLRLNLVHGWLFTIDSACVKSDDSRARVIAYQEECYSVLKVRFTGRAAGQPAPIGPPERRLFPDWPMDEMRTKRGVAEMHRLNFGPLGAQWIIPQLGLPSPPPKTIEHGRQYVLTLIPNQEAA